MGPVDSISSTPDSRLTRSLQNSRSGPKEIKNFRRCERKIEQHPTLLVRLKAFGEFSGLQHERRAYLKDFLLSGGTSTNRGFRVKIAMKAAKQLAVRMDAFLRRFARVYLVWFSSTFRHGQHPLPSISMRERPDTLYR